MSEDNPLDERITALEKRCKELRDTQWACLASVATVIIGLTAKKVFDQEDHERILAMAEDLATMMSEAGGSEITLGALFEGPAPRRRRRSRKRKR